MKKLLLIYFLFLSFYSFSQEENRIQSIKNNLEILAQDNEGLTENLKLEINVANVTLSNFLIAISTVHKLNITVDPSLQSITIVNNFSNVTVADLLVFLCKEYQLDINFTGNILSIVQYTPPPIAQPEKEIAVQYDPLNNLISMDLKNDPLDNVFRKIIDVSGQNLLFSNGMENIPLNLYITNVPFDLAIKKLAEANTLTSSKSRDGFYLFNTLYDPENSTQNRGIIARNAFSSTALNYQVLDTLHQILTVDFNNTPIEKIIHELSYDLKLDVYTATPLSQAGSVTFKAKQITYDVLLERIFESLNTTSSSGQEVNLNNTSNRIPNQNQNSTPVSTNNFTFKKENNTYFFGTANQLSVRSIEVINTNARRISTQSNSFGSYATDAEALVNILPDDIKTELDIKIDYELNSFLISGPAANINRFKNFITEIDKPVPVILIEVMILEVKKSASVETGISWGIGDEPVKTQGAIFPEANLTLGATTINKVIGGFDGFGSFNIGKVVPEFFATIKAMEQNGNIKIRSTPKLSTLNGHRARLSIGETTYYVVTNQNFFGSQIPTSSEIRNYQPIDAELAISIKPLVSGNGQVTLDINVLQSDFSGERIEKDAPPGLTSREFSSIIRMQNQDLVILGGLEEKMKNDSGNGVPLLARIPVIKWLFSSRKREDSKRKLTILIKPTVIY